MYKYVKRELEVLDLPALVENVGHGGDQVDFPLVVDLLQAGRHRHVRQAVAEISRGKIKKITKK